MTTTMAIPFDADAADDLVGDNFVGEQWRDIEIAGFNGQYQISDYGRCQSPNGILRVSYPSPKGTGWLNLKGNTYRVDRLVLETFVGLPPGPTYGPRHKNGDLHDNRLANLVWEKGLQRAKPKKRAKKAPAKKPAITVATAVSQVHERRLFFFGNIEVVANPQEGWVDLAQADGQAKFSDADIPGLIELLQYYLSSR